MSQEIPSPIIATPSSTDLAMQDSPVAREEGAAVPSSSFCTPPRPPPLPFPPAKRRRGEADAPWAAPEKLAEEQEDVMREAKTAERQRLRYSPLSLREGLAAGLAELKAPEDEFRIVFGISSPRAFSIVGQPMMSGMRRCRGFYPGVSREHYRRAGAVLPEIPGFQLMLESCQEFPHPQKAGTPPPSPPRSPSTSFSSTPGIRMKLPALWDGYLLITHGKSAEDPEPFCANPATRRVKSRALFRSDDFQFELTSWKIGEETSDERGAMYEMELVLWSSAGLAFPVNPKDEKVLALVGKMEELLTRLTRKVGAADPRWFGDVLHGPIMDPDKKQAVLRTVRECFGDFFGGSSEVKELPKAKTAYLTRADFVKIQSRGDYDIREQPIGMRCFLIVGERECLIVDKRCQIYECPALQYVASHRETITSDDGELQLCLLGHPACLAYDGEKYSSVFDGYLVRNRGEDVQWRPGFLAVDLLMYRGKTIIDKSVEERFKILKEFKAKIRIAKMDTDDAYDNECSFRLCACFHKKDVACFFDNIRTGAKDERLFSLNRKKNGHLVQGAVLIANRPYLPASAVGDPFQFKWKFPDAWSMNFEVECRSRYPGVSLLSLSQEGAVVESVRPKLDEESSYLVPSQAQGNVAEFGFDPKSGLWIYKRVRSDKRDADNTTVFAIKYAIVAQNIGQEEFIYRTRATPGFDDWETRTGMVVESLTRHQIGVVSDPVKLLSSLPTMPQRMALCSKLGGRLPSQLVQQQQRQQLLPPPASPPRKQPTISPVSGSPGSRSAVITSTTSAPR